jgi:hypothetical protein
VQSPYRSPVRAIWWDFVFGVNHRNKLYMRNILEQVNALTGGKLFFFRGSFSFLSFYLSFVLFLGFFLFFEIDLTFNPTKILNGGGLT